MRNFEVAFIFYDIADMLEIKGENFFKIRAYRRAAYTIENLTMEIEDLAKQSRLSEIQGIGKALSEKIYEILNTGTSGYYQELKNEVPRGLVEMLKVPGLGPRKIKLIYDHLGISSIEELKKAARSRKLSKLPGIGVKTEQAILKGIKTLQGNTGKVLLASALPIAERVVSLLSSMTEVIDIKIAGSLRRKKEMVKDIVIVIATNEPEIIIKDFLRFPPIAQVLAKTVFNSSKISFPCRSIMSPK
jgi:DNA polymerase (family 10)